MLHMKGHVFVAEKRMTRGDVFSGAQLTEK
jgi:hypothetical protein